MSNEVDRTNGTVSDGVINFAHIIRKIAVENVLISPLLLEAILSLLYLGADGRTADELRQLLQLERFKSNVEMANFYATHLDLVTGEVDTKLQLCNNIFVDNSCQLGEEFPKIALKYFHTNTQPVNLGDVEQLCALINASTAHITTDINEALPASAAASASASAEIPSALVLMAANFKSKWFLPFSAYRTGIYEFHVDAAIRKPVPMLYDHDMFVKFGEFRELDARAIELPYEHDQELSMLVLLPNKRDGLPTLLEQLNVHNLIALTERMQVENVQVLLPKFRIVYEHSWKEELKALGARSVFAKDANFNNLIHQNFNGTMHIADILQKLSIEVHESGSERPAVEGNKPIVISNCIDSNQKFFRADHPFFFAVHNGNVTYLAGCVSSF